MPTHDMSAEREFSAHYLARAGRPRAALQRAEAGLEAARRLGAIPDLARAHRVLARILAASEREVAGLDAPGHESEALRLAQEGEAFHWAEVGDPDQNLLEIAR